MDALAARFGMTWTLRDTTAERQRVMRQRVMLLVSRFDHCLADLPYRWRLGELPMLPVAVVSNHPREALAHLDLGGVPFHHLPVTRQIKMEQEAQIWALVQETRAEVVVLARYMQCCPTVRRRSCTGVASTSITRFRRASRARGPTTRRTRGG